MKDEKDPIFFTIDDKEYCIETKALSEMLAADGFLFVSGDSGPFWETADGDKGPCSIHVNCNDLFAWGCADSEPLPMSEIGAFYKAWKAGRVDNWASARRNLQPQSPIRDRMKKNGKWDEAMEALPKNPDDKKSQKTAKN